MRIGHNVVSKKLRTVLQQILSGRSDSNCAFGDLVALLLALGFERRVRGDHHILWKEGVAEIINLQPKGSKAKPYQVRQVRSILAAYQLGFDRE
jgi:hypothetical protein